MCVCVCERARVFPYNTICMYRMLYSHVSAQGVDERMINVHYYYSGLKSMVEMQLKGPERPESGNR